MPNPGRERGRAYSKFWRTTLAILGAPLILFVSRLAVYVVHAFQKKSPKGIKTARRDADLVSERLRQAYRDYEERYDQAEK